MSTKKSDLCPENRENKNSYDEHEFLSNEERDPVDKNIFKLGNNAKKYS